MFLAVSFFIGFAYVLYHQQALTKAYFDNVKFNEPKRLVRIYNQDDVEILRVSLGEFICGIRQLAHSAKVVNKHTYK